MNEKKYLCPHCCKELEPSDLEEYAFVCCKCDENFYKFEAVETENDAMDIWNSWRFDNMADAAIKNIAPVLSSLYCDVGLVPLLKIWHEQHAEFKDEFMKDLVENGLPENWNRPDCYYLHELLREIEQFVMIAMENDF